MDRDAIEGHHDVEACGDTKDKINENTAGDAFEW